MKLTLATAALATYAASASNFRGKNRSLLGYNGCRFMIAEDLNEGPGHSERVFQCEMDDGTTRDLEMTPGQKETIDLLLEEGGVVPGKSRYNNPNAAVDNKKIHVPPGSAMNFVPEESADRRRRLVAKFGNTHYLVVKVIDVNGKTHPHNTATMSDKVFGTNGDTITMTSQTTACSAGQLNIVAGPKPTATEQQLAGITAATTDVGNPTGVMEVSIGIAIDDVTQAASRYDVRNAIISAVQTKLGFNLPGPFDHVMFNIENCYFDCGWAAYAYINSWNQVYQGNYYYMAGVQMHEYGHNLGMAHSGGLNGATYTDHTCSMGNPLYADNLGQMCFNPAKSFYIGWYNSGGIVLFDPQATTSRNVTLMGVGQWKDYQSAYPVVVKVESGGSTDAFIGFNRAAGANIQNDEADDLVTIVETGNNGLSYSQSFLKGYIGAGQTFQISNWMGLGFNLKVTVHSINLAANPSTASITVSAGCNTNADCDDGVYCNGAEACINGECTAGTPVTCLDDGLFCNGAEVCDEATNGCVSSGSPCAPNDGNFCNGVESCDETSDSCNVTPPVDCSGETYGCGASKICETATGNCVANPSNPGGDDGICAAGVSGGTEYTDNPQCTADCCGEIQSATAGNGICEEGEDCVNTPEDCGGRLGGKPNSRFCCWGGTNDPGTDYAVRCDVQSLCGPPEGCSLQTGTSTFCCGDGVCETGEDYFTCPEDCTTAPVAPPPTLAPTLAPVGGCKNGGISCVANSECCSGKCDSKGKNPSFTCNP